MLTRKTFEMWAEMVRACPTEAKPIVAEVCAQRGAESNPRFDLVQFMVACGLASPIVSLRKTRKS